MLLMKKEVQGAVHTITATMKRNIKLLEDGSTKLEFRRVSSLEIVSVNWASANSLLLICQLLLRNPMNIAQSSTLLTTCGQTFKFKSKFILWQEGAAGQI